MYLPSIIISQRVLVVLAAGAIGCVADRPAVSAVTSAVGCSGTGCNQNSPVVAGVPFFELERHGLPNEQGFKIMGFHSSTGVAYQIDVQRANLVGIDSYGRVALQGNAVLGSVISLLDPAGRLWEIEIGDGAAMQFWARPDGWAQTYELRVHVPGQHEWENLCRRPPAAGDWPGIVTHAILFEGDRYRQEDKTVWAIGNDAAGWFNIACAGTAMAKMHLTRHNEAGANPDLPTIKEQRQAMLRALTATVCPGSESFTGSGEPLQPVDAVGLLPNEDDVSNLFKITSLEALWDDKGALCIGEQRLEDPRSMPREEARELLDRLPLECGGVPKCVEFGDLPDGWRKHGMVLTLNPLRCRRPRASGARRERA